jgi:hypothetical protein
MSCPSRLLQNMVRMVTITVYLCPVTRGCAALTHNPIIASNIEETGVSRSSSKYCKHKCSVSVL